MSEKKETAQGKEKKEEVKASSSSKPAAKKKAASKEYTLYCKKKCQLSDGKVYEKGDPLNISFSSEGELENALYNGKVSAKERKDDPMRGKLKHFSKEKVRGLDDPKSVKHEPKTLLDVASGAANINGIKKK